VLLPEWSEHLPDLQPQRPEQTDCHWQPWELGGEYYYYLYFLLERFM